MKLFPTSEKNRFASTAVAVVLAMFCGHAAASLPSVPDSTWMANGPIRAIVQYGNIIWIGGQFTQLIQPASQGGQVISVTNLAAIDATTGAPIPGLTPPAVTGPISIAPGQNCTIEVDFAPSTTGTIDGLVTITDNASNSPQTVTLTGTGTGTTTAAATTTTTVQTSSTSTTTTTSGAPAVSLSPTSLSFGNQQVGPNAAQLFATLTNTGTASLSISSVVSSPGDYAQSVQSDANTCEPIVYALAVAGGKLYIGGAFNSVGGFSRRNLAAIDATTGAVDTNFNPNIGNVLALAADATKLYVGGTFSTANGQTRTRLAAFNFDGTLNSTWMASADDRPRAFAFAPDGQSIFVVGFFKNVAGPDGVYQSRNSIARLDTTTGVVLSWNAACPCSSSEFGLGVAVGNGNVYLAVGASDWTAAYDLNTAKNLYWVDTFGQVQDVTLTPTEVAIGGHFHDVGLAPSAGTSVCDPSYPPGSCAPRDRIAALSLSGNLDQNWAPPMDGDYDGVWRLMVNGPQLYAVGEFDTVNGVLQQKIARFTDSTAYPAVAVTPVSWNFGNQAVGTVSASQTFTLTNTGNATLTFSVPISTSGDFSQNNTCGSSLAAGGNCTITVTFSPTTTGLGLGAITLTDNANLSPQTVKLAGTGTAPAVSLVPNALTFVNQQVNSTSGPQPVTLTNTGSGTLNISGISASTNFLESNNCGNSLAPGANCTINVSFSPTTTGTLNGTVTVNDDASNSPQTVSLTGTGVSSATGIGFVQAHSTGSNSSGDSLTMNTTAGDTVVVAVTFPSTTPSVSSVTDSGGSTYTFVAAAVRGTSVRTEMWVSQGVAASTSITIHLSQTAKHWIEVGEYSGVTGLGMNATTNGSSTNLSVALQTQVGNSWVIAAFGEQNSTAFNAKTGNLRDSGSFTVSPTTIGGAINDNSAVSPSSVTNAVTMNTSGPWAAVALELRPTPNPAPTVTAISPSSGTTAGGTAISITGTGFVSGATVILGSAAATNVAVVSSTSITATTGPSTAGVVNVAVTNSDGQSGTLTGGYTYVNPPPKISGISPNFGSVNGGTAVTISGTGFLTGATVTLGGTLATNVTVVNSGSITATTPAHASGAVNVVVTNTDGQSATLTGGFTYSATSNPISFVQAVGNGANAATNVVTINTHTGDDVVVVVAFPSTTPSVSSVIDSGGSTYKLVQALNNGSSVRVELWEAHNVVASTSVTINISTVAKSQVEVAEYSGVQSLGTVNAVLGSGNPLSVALTTQNNNSWVVAGFGEKNGSTFTPQTGNLRGSGSLTVSTVTVGAAVNDNTAATPSFVTNAVNTNPTGAWASVAVELVP